MYATIDRADMERHIGARDGQCAGFVLRNANMALITDQPFVMTPGTPFIRYRLSAVIAVWRSGAFSGACAGGIYSAAAKGGTAWVAAAQSWANLTGAGQIVFATIDTAMANAKFASAPPILSLTTGNGAALRADLFAFVQMLD